MFPNEAHRLWGTRGQVVTAHHRTATYCAVTSTSVRVRGCLQVGDAFPATLMLKCRTQSNTYDLSAINSKSTECTQHNSRWEVASASGAW